MSAELSPTELLDALRCALAENRRLRAELDAARAEGEAQKRLAEQSVVRLDAIGERARAYEEAREKVLDLCDLSRDLEARALSTLDVLEPRSAERARALQRDAQAVHNRVADVRAMLAGVVR